MGRYFHFFLDRVFSELFDSKSSKQALKMVATILLVIPTTLSAYPTPVDVDGAMHNWPITVDAPQVYFEFVASDESLNSFLEPIVQESSQLWADVDTALIELEPSNSEHPAQITIYYDSSIEGGATAAGYSIFDDVEEGVPKHCSIHIAVNDDSDYEALQKTTLHEIGHCLGLAHSLVPTSIMSYQLEQNSFALALDDRAAISRIYPMDGKRAKTPRGCTIGVNFKKKDNGPIFLTLFAVPIIITVIRQRLYF